MLEAFTFMIQPIASYYRHLSAIHKDIGRFAWYGALYP